MFAAIYGYELRRALRSPSLYVYFGILFGLGFLLVALACGAISGGVMDFGAGGKVQINSPYGLNTIVAIAGLLGIVIVAAVAGQATHQDVANDMTSFFYTAPISKFDYLGGRFAAAFTQLLLAFAGVGIGAYLAAHIPWPDRSHIGPDHLAAYLQPYLVLVLPNVFFMGAAFFALAVWTRRMLPVYVISALGIVAYQVAQQLTSNLNHDLDKITALLDPFGINAETLITQYWTPFMRNTQLLPFEGVLLWNRVLWVALGAGILALTYWRFSMAVPAGRARRRAPAPEASAASANRANAPLPEVRPDFSAAASLGQLLSGTWLQFVETVRSVFFIVVAVAGFAMTIVILLNAKGDATTYPLTYIMLEWGRAAFGIFALAITTFYAGELVWRDREAKIDQLIDSQPVSTWVLFGSKLGALMLVQVVLVVLVFAAGIAAQIGQGYYRFELGQYAHELLANRLVSFWILCSLALWLQVLIDQRYLGYVAMVVYFAATLAAGPLGFEDYLYRYGQTPPYQYSDLDAYGVFAAPLAWFHLYWGIAAAALAIVTGLIWVRGTDGGFRARLRIAAARCSTLPRAALATCAIAFACTGAYIYYNTHLLNTYVTQYAADELRAQYEKFYKRYQTMPEPRIVGVVAGVDLFPKELAASISGRLILRNETAAPLHEVAVTLPVEGGGPADPQYGLTSLAFDGGQNALVDDPKHYFFLYRLAKPLAPGATTVMHFTERLEHHGFPNDRPDTTFAENGTNLSQNNLPQIGYLPNLELSDDSTRHRHGLTAVKRLPPPQDQAARRNSAISSDADWVNFDVTLSTDPDQIAIFPGRLVGSWTQDGRRYFHYRSESPMQNIYQIDSGRYAVSSDRWNGVDLSIYYHPGHDFNLASMTSSMKQSLAYYSKEFGPYQFDELRIVEFPRYSSYAESLPATIPYSEAIGFITRYDRSDPQAYDRAFYVTAHEVAHQWWGHQIVTASTQGAGIIETLAQYSALMVMKHAFGLPSMKNFLRHELNTYLDGRGLERNEEEPLYLNEDNQGYVYYSKGGQVMFTLAQYIGEERLNRALRQWLDAYKFRGAPYPTTLDLLRYLRKATPPQYAGLLADTFEKITIYDARPVAASYRRTADGRYAVTLTIRAKKEQADTHGREHEVPVDDWIPVGVQDAQGRYLYLGNAHVVGENTTLTLKVAGRPDTAGVDPLDEFVDRTPDNDSIPVTPL